jgi:hypothetical protein
MSRLEIKQETLRALFALSGNLCAFPGCTHELVTPSGIFVAQICHIEAANEGGQRFNPASTDDYRRSLPNLVVLCYKHHKETDDVQRYPVEALREFKAAHESTFGKKQFKIDESTLYQIERDMSAFWEQVRRTNENKHVAPDFAVQIKTSVSPKIKTSVSPIDVFSEIYKAADRIQEFTSLLQEDDATLNKKVLAHLGALGYDLRVYQAVPYYKNPFVNRAWEIHNLGIPNSFTDLYVSIMNAEIRFLEEHLKMHAQDQRAWDRLEELKKEMFEAAKTMGYAD